MARQLGYMSWHHNVAPVFLLIIQSLPVPTLSNASPIMAQISSAQEAGSHSSLQLADEIRRWPELGGAKRLKKGAWRRHPYQAERTRRELAGITAVLSLELPLAQSALSRVSPASLAPCPFPSLPQILPWALLC
jgi:hypothetical protein